MNINLELKKFLITILGIDIIVIVLFLIFQLFNYSVIIGIIFGSIIVFLNFISLISVLKRAILKNSTNARYYILLHYVIRYIIILIYLYIVIKSKNINTLSAIPVLFAPKIHFYLWKFFNKKEG